MTESEELTQKLKTLKEKQHLKIRSAIAVKNRIEGETMIRSWTQSNKMEKPRDIIYALRKPQWNNNAEQDPYEKNSRKMAELAQDYHENIQKEGIIHLEINAPKRHLPLSKKLPAKTKKTY